MTVTMLSYRNITEDDCEFILQHWAGNSIVFGNNLERNELLSMIQLWDTKEYKGNYYEMFGVLNNNVLVGTFSLYQRDSDLLENAVYLGIEIDINNRNKGFGTEAVFMAFKAAKDKGMKKVFSQARILNISSVKLHKKCGFEIMEKTLSKRGHVVYNYEKVL
jgi:RimJ/RimL family protein N-acetyltransferase